MPAVFYSGKPSLPVRLAMAADCALAWVLGGARDSAAMKRRMRLGYEGALTDNAARYDELGEDHYERAGMLLLDTVDVDGRNVLDVGCGTGIVSLLALERKAARVVGVDIAENKVGRCQAKAAEVGIGPDRAEFRWADAESLPLESSRWPGDRRAPRSW